MSSKYQPLADYLLENSGIEVRLCFEEIEKLLDDSLPASAYKFPAWWANQNDTKNRPQAAAWMEAGFKATVHLESKTVFFAKTENSSQHTQTSVSSRSAGYAPTEAIISDTVPKDWFWEGHVAKGIAKHLEENGWVLNSMADTYSKERGVDIKASKNCQILLIEVKGYPSSFYRDTKRSQERKPTNPSSQAQHWYSHALLKSLRLQTKYPDVLVAIGLPDFPRYRKLFEETKSGLEKLKIGLFALSENGVVKEWSGSGIVQKI